MYLQRLLPKDRGRTVSPSCAVPSTIWQIEDWLRTLVTSIRPTRSVRFRKRRLPSRALPEIAFSRLLGYLSKSRSKGDQDYSGDETDGEGDDPELQRVELLQLP